MVTKISKGIYNDETNLYEVEFDVRCKSTDEKPTDVTNGSTLIEIDTGKLYIFDADGSNWYEV